MKIAVVGAGWSGLAAAVFARQAGHEVTVFESSRMLGGRARAMQSELPDGRPVILDNGQHILIGAYQETLALMDQVGVKTSEALLRLPLTLMFPDGHGLRLPTLASPLDVLVGVMLARGWSWRERLSLMRHAWSWQQANFLCDEGLTVAHLCASMAPTITKELIGPLCESALNTPPERASAQCLLRVLKDALFSAPGGSNLLLPMTDLGRLFPQAAADWLARQQVLIHTGQRVSQACLDNGHWQVNGQRYESVILAVTPIEGCRLLENSIHGLPTELSAPVTQWIELARKLEFEAITTVYAWSPKARLSHPMLALSASPQTPAQFVFDRGQLGGPPGLLAFVVSASSGDQQTLQSQVLLQAQAELGLQLLPVQTVVEKRATFACLPGLRRPAAKIGAGLLACGDYVDGPYPATLEGAIRNARCAVNALTELPS